jgi:hypothetical protein
MEIKEIYAFIAKDDESEGICAFSIGSMMMPMVAADFARVESLMGIAQTIATETGKQISIYKFTHKEIHGVINPQIPQSHYEL